MAVFAGNGSAGSPSFTFSSDTNTGMYRPGTDQLSLVTGANTRIFVDSDGKVAIGTSTPSSRLFTVDGDIGLLSGTTERFSIYRSLTPSTYNIRGGNFLLNLESEGTTESGVIFSTGTTSAAERARVTSDGYLRMASGSGGIQFNGDTAATNALDDYEEGTWTPAGYGNFTVDPSASGRYIKIGKMVWLSLSLGACTTTTSGSYITGVPFDAGASHDMCGVAVDQASFNPVAAASGATLGVTLRTTIIYFERTAISFRDRSSLTIVYRIT